MTKFQVYVGWRRRSQGSGGRRWEWGMPNEDVGCGMPLLSREKSFGPKA